MTPEELLATGDPVGALKALQQQVRNNAADVRRRTFLRSEERRVGKECKA
jgi:hypothetical protein